MSAQDVLSFFEAAATQRIVTLEMSDRGVLLDG